MRRPSGRATWVAVVVAIALGVATPLIALAVSHIGDSSPATETSPHPPETTVEPTDVSFVRDAAPIIQQKCAGCHQPGGIAPFSFDSAESISSRASLISAVVRERLMPPWPPGSESPAYVGEAERTLTAHERATLVAWAKGGGEADGPARKPLPDEITPVRDGERVVEVAMPGAYPPKAEEGTTDDYRCFMLDPKLSEDASVTSARIEPGSPRVVHHVILFRIARSQTAEAARLDAASPGLGWTCFGGIGTSGSTDPSSLNDSDWVAAWAPGWGGERLPDGLGVPLEAGSRIVMQVHYNLLNGRAPDRSRAVLTVAPASAGLAPVQTVLLPAPVELACAADESGPLCNRESALVELRRKYGSIAAFVPPGLLFLCGKRAKDVAASDESSCDRQIQSPMTIIGAAGHMHLLGTSIRLELNPGTPEARVLLDIPRWDFHWQNSYTLTTPVDAKQGDVLRVTCRHDVTRRHHGTQGVPKTPRYILWGEGTTDEMCLGLLQVTRG